jgi:hypothetical protein
MPGAAGTPASVVVVSVPIADRQTSFTFYREGLGLDAIGEPAETVSQSHCSSLSMTACA